MTKSFKIGGGGGGGWGNVVTKSTLIRYFVNLRQNLLGS